MDPQLLSSPRALGSGLQNCEFLKRRALQQLDQGNFQEAIGSFEQALLLASSVFGGNSREAETACREVSHKVVAALRLTYEDSDSTVVIKLLLQYLKVLSLCDVSVTAPDLCETYLAISCAYRKLSNWELAELFSKKALRLAKAMPDLAISRCELCLGMCAALSGSLQHTRAIKYAKKAARFARRDLLKNAIDRDEKLTLLSVSCHNVGVQEERLSHYEAAGKWYKKAVDVLEKHGNETHMGMLGNMRKSMTDALRAGMRRTKRNASMADLKCLTSIPSLYHSGLGSPKSRNIHRRHLSLGTTSLSQELSLKLQTLLVSRTSSFYRSHMQSPLANPAEIRGFADVGEPARLRCQVPVSGCSTTWDTPREPSLPRRTEWSERGRSAVRIQAWLRGRTARKQARLLREYASRPSLLRRAGLRLMTGELALVSIVDTSLIFEVTICAASHNETRIQIPKGDGLTAEAVIQGLRCRGRSLSLMQAAIRIQKQVRGFLARRHHHRLLVRKCISREVLFRGGVRLAGIFTVASLIRNGEERVLMVESEPSAQLLVPPSLRELPARELLQKVALRSGELSLSVDAPECTYSAEAVISPSRETTAVLARSVPMQIETIPHFATAETLPLDEMRSDSLPLHDSSELKGMMSPEADLMIEEETAAIVIQKSYRGHLARLDVRLQKYREKKLQYRGFKYLNLDKLCGVVIYQEKHDLVVHAVDMKTREIQELRFDSSNSAEDLFFRLEGSDWKLTLAPTREKQQKAAQLIQKLVRGVLARARFRELLRKCKRKMQFLSTKIADGETFNVAIYQLLDRIQIETFKRHVCKHLKYRSHSVFFSLDDIRTIYGRLPSWKELFDDIVLKCNALSICPVRKLEGNVSVQTVAAMVRQSELKGDPVAETRIAVRASKKLDERLWVVTMNVLGDDSQSKVQPEDIVEFTAFCCSKQERLKVQTQLQNLADALRLPLTDLRPIGTTAIQKLIKLKDGALTIDYTTVIPSTSHFVVLLQACVRGFLVRRRTHGKLSKGNLITCTVVKFEEQSWVLYGYRELPNIHIVGINRLTKEKRDEFIPGSVFLKFPPSLSTKRVLESLIFPKVVLVEPEGAKQGSYYVLKRRSGNINRRGSSLNNEWLFGNTQSPLSSPSPRMGPDSPVLRPTIRTRPFGKTMQTIAPLKAISIALVRKKLSLPASPSAPGLNLAHKLLLRSAVEISGTTYLASFFSAASLLRIHLLDKEGGHSMQLILDSEIEGSTKSAELRCEDLLNRLEIVTGEQGPHLIIRQAGEVLHRRSHYISNRLFHVTIYRNEAGVRIEALDPVRKTTLKLEVALILREPTQKQMSDLMNKVEVWNAQDGERLVVNNEEL